MLFDGLVGRCQHGADQLFRLTERDSHEATLKMLLDLADALVKLATLQGDSAQQIGAHLSLAHGIKQLRLTGLNAAMTGAEKLLMLCHPIADLGQIKDLMNPVGLVMDHDLVATVGVLPSRVMRHCGQPVIRVMICRRPL